MQKLVRHGSGCEGSGCITRLSAARQIRFGLSSAAEEFRIPVFSACRITVYSVQNPQYRCMRRPLLYFITYNVVFGTFRDTFPVISAKTVMMRLLPSDAVMTDTAARHLPA